MYKSGYYDGKYYISASLLGEYIYDKRRGVDRFYGKDVEYDPILSYVGTKIHERFGFGNEELMGRDMILDDGTIVCLFGVADKVLDDRVIELKTVRSYVSDKKRSSSVAQLLVYLYIYDKKLGELWFYSRGDDNIIERMKVDRNDDELRKIVNSFISDLMIKW